MKFNAVKSPLITILIISTVIIQNGQAQRSNNIIVPSEVKDIRDALYGSKTISVTNKQLDAVAKLRSGLEAAVNANTYKHGSQPNLLPLKMAGAKGAGDFVGSTNTISQEQVVGSAFPMNPNITTGNQNNSIISSSSSGNARVITSEMGAGITNNTNIDSENAEEDERTLDQLEQPEYENRDVLQIRSVHEIHNFTIDETVIEWRTLQRKYEGKHALIGILKTGGIILVNEINGTYQITKTLSFESTPTSFDTFTRYNYENQHIEGIIIVGVNNKLIWIRVQSEFNEMSIVWVWNVEKSLAMIQYFQMGSTSSVLVISNQTYNNSTQSADIYHLDLDKMDFWLFQSIPLTTATKSVGILDTYQHVILAIPQIDKVELFICDKVKNKAKSFKYNNHFVSLKTIESKNVKSVAAFHMSGHKYLAIGGEKPQILRYQKGQLHPQVVLSQWGLVESFLPIPARTYRDDLILLIQHTVSFETHYVRIIEALVWDGLSFETSLNIPCYPIGTNDVHDLSCLLSQQMENTIEGSTVIQEGKLISLIVPRVHEPSSMFELELELTLKSNSKEMKLNILENILNEAINGTTMEKSVIEDIVNELNQSPKARTNTRLNIVHLETSEFRTSETLPEATEIEINNQMYKKNDFHINVNSTLKDINDLEVKFNDKRQTLTSTLLSSPRQHLVQELRNMKINNIEFDSINGISSDNLVFVDDKKELEFPGVTIFEEEVVVNEIEEQRPQFQSRAANDDVLEQDTILINGDISFETYNGVPWSHIQQLLEQVDVNVDGQVTVNEINTRKIDGFAYPECFLWRNYEAHPLVINASKEFTNTATIHSISGPGSINDITPNDIILLTGRQKITGRTTFNQLEVTQSFDVSGNVEGRGLTDILPNPNLLQKNIVDVACTFNNLEVLGDIFVAGSVFRQDFFNILDDVVYKEEKNVEITGFKKFADLKANFDLQLGLLNQIPISNYITSNTDQNISISELTGNILVEELVLNGLIDNINVTELEDKAIKNTGDQFIPSTMVFNTDIMIDQLEITTTINRIAITDMINVHGNRTINAGSIVFHDEVEANQLFSENEFIGDGQINSVNLKDYDLNRLSKSRKQIINAPLKFEKLVSNANLEVDLINDINATDYITRMKAKPSIVELIESGAVSIQNLLIDGSLEVNYINKVNINDLLDNVIWLNQPNKLSETLRFLDEIRFNAPLNIDFINKKVNFTEFLSDVVLRNQKNVVFSGEKILMSGIIIDGNLNADTLNQIPFNYVWNRRTNQKINGNLELLDSVSIEHLQVDGYMNGAFAGNLRNMYGFDELNQIHFIVNDLQIADNIRIDRLDSAGNIQDIPKIHDYFTSLVKLNEDCTIVTPLIFNSLSITNDIDIGIFNGIDLWEYFNNAVRTNSDNPVKLSVKLILNEPTQIDQLTIIDTLFADFVAGCSVDDWFSKAIRVDHPLIYPASMQFGVDSVHATNLNVQYINDQPLGTILTKYFPRNITWPVLAEYVITDQPINVQGTVNRMNLPTEYENTLMIQGNQVVRVPTEIESCRILNSLEIYGLINDRNLSDLITFNQTMNPHSSMDFRNLFVKELIVDSTLSGIDFNQWHNESLWRYGKSHQKLIGDRKFKNLTIISPMNGEIYINGTDSRTIIENIQKVGQTADELVQKWKENYKLTCKKLYEMIENTAKPSYFVQYFEDAFRIKVRGIITAILFFQQDDDNYLMFSIECTSFLYRWEVNIQKYKLISHQKTGSVQQWIQVNDDSNTVYLISNSFGTYDACHLSGTIIWLFNGNRLEFRQQLCSSNEYGNLHVNPYKSGHFYALRQGSNVAVEFDIKSFIKSEWSIPSDGGHRFVPYDVDLGIALSDGKQMYRLNLNEDKPKIRRQRCPTIGLVGERFFNFNDRPQLKLPNLVNQRIKESADMLRKQNSKFKGKLGLHMPITYPFNKDSSVNIPPMDAIDLNQVNLDDTDPLPTINPYAPTAKSSITEPTATTVSPVIKTTTISTTTDAIVGGPLDTIMAIGTLYSKVGDVVGKLDTAVRVFKTVDSIISAGRKSNTNSETVGSAKQNVTAPTFIAERNITAAMNLLKLIHSNVGSQIGKLDGLLKELNGSMPNSFDKTQLDNSQPELVGGAKETITDVYKKVGGVVDKLDKAVKVYKTIDTIISFGTRSSTKSDEVSSVNEGLLEVTESEPIVGGPKDVLNNAYQRVGKVVDTLEKSVKAYRAVESIMKGKSAELGIVNPFIKDDLPGDYRRRLHLNRSRTAADENEFDDEIIGDAFSDQFNKLDAIAEKLLNMKLEIKQKLGIKSNQEDDNYGNYEVGSQFNSTGINANVSDSEVIVGDAFSDKFTTLNALAEILLDKKVELKQKLGIKSQQDDNYGSNHQDDYTVGSSDGSQSNKTSNATEEIVGDAFSDKFNVLNGLAEVLIDKKVELKQKLGIKSQKDDNYQNQYDDDDDYLVGNPQQIDHNENSAPDMNRQIAVEIPLGGVVAADNSYLPGKNDGDIIALQVGIKKYRRKLIAVSTYRNSSVPGRYDNIHIYEDVLEGRLFQSIPCTWPRSLIPIHIQDNTLLAFLEGDSTVRIYSYKGLQGFVLFHQFKLAGPAVQLNFISLPSSSERYACHKHYLAVTMVNDIHFYEAKMIGKCAINLNLKCDLD